MKAAVYFQYGSPEVLQVKEVTKPTPKDNEILIRIHATAANSGDCRLRAADPFAVRFIFGLFKPKLNILGGVLSGTVESVGKNVTNFKAGDQVFGSTTMKFGAYAEYIALPDTAPLALKPDSLSHEEAAVLPFGGVTALHFLQKAGIKPGQKVLIYGASGSVGSAAVQIAKHLGAEVTGVCGTSNVDMVKSLGADHVLDYSKTDFSKIGQQYDFVFETVNKAPVSLCVSLLKKGGTLILGAAMPGEMLQGQWAAMTRGIKLISGVALPTADAAQYLQKMAIGGELKAVIDQTFPLEQISRAHAHVEKGHKRGNVVVTMSTSAISPN